MSNPISWGADVPISMPDSRNPSEGGVPIEGGYVFGQYGLAHDISETDIEVFYQPMFAPLPSPEGAD